MTFVAWVLEAVAALGLAQCVAGWLLVRRFAKAPAPSARSKPPLTVLKPLCGDELLLLEALTSCCRQDYPPFQVVFGAHRADDPALPTARAIQAMFPLHDISIVIDPALHGQNRKISNLMNMLPFAKHDLLVISDSDQHVAPDYLERIVAALEQPNVGLISTLHVGRPAGGRWPPRLSACQMKYTFLPGVLVARAMARRDCLGGTMALTRQTLEAAGGLRALVAHVADDNILGQLVAATGRDVGIADTVVAATVPEQTLQAMWQHEMRWARTIRTLAPVLFGLSVLQYPVFWALLAALVWGGPAAWAALILAIAVRIGAARGVDHALARKLAPVGALPAAPLWLLPARDVLSVVQIAVSYMGAKVVWRGATLESRPWRLAASP